MKFKITRPGRYTVPNWGHLDTRVDTPSDERLLALYKDKGFPWIALQPGKETVAFLKKQKLTNAQLSVLILQANSKEEIETLLKVSSKAALKKIAETRLQALKNSNP
tara:strand:+ start:6013 stop:6333 length:321 start_codon:yes stop_codon:yes gene_type:complete